MPGYVASPYKTIRLNDDAEGIPQYQTSVDVRNTQPVAGLVKLQYPTEHSWDVEGPYMIESYESNGVRIEGNSARRINLVTSYVFRTLYLDPGLSLNRTPIKLLGTHSSPSEPTGLNPQPFHEEIDWSPGRADGIIVDDLDSEFSVSQPRLHTARRASIGPMGWLRRPVLEAENDQGLPSLSTDRLTGFSQTYLSGYRSPPGAWARKWEPGAFGRFRQTTAVARVRDRPVQATFAANLPQTTSWRLEYHSPRTLSEIFGNQETTYSLVVKNGEKSWEIELNAYSLSQGWNSVGEFDLETGLILVELESATRGGTTYADAIRWTMIDKQ